MQAPSRSFAIIVAFVAAPLALSAQGQRALTLEDYFRVESASNPAISPRRRRKRCTSWLERAVPRGSSRARA